MSNILVSIKPAPAFPVQANAFIITGSTGLPPVFNVAIGVLTKGKPAIPAKGVPGHNGYVPEVPAVQDTFDVQKQLQVPMDKETWDKWQTTTDDAQYIRNYVAAQLGFSVQL